MDLACLFEAILSRSNTPPSSGLSPTPSVPTVHAVRCPWSRGGQTPGQEGPPRATSAAPVAHTSGGHPLMCWSRCSGRCAATTRTTGRSIERPSGCTNAGHPPVLHTGTHVPARKGHRTGTRLSHPVGRRAHGPVRVLGPLTAIWPDRWRWVAQWGVALYLIVPQPGGMTGVRPLR
jgi:hypothetical protein